MKKFFTLLFLLSAAFSGHAQVVLNPALAPFYHGVASGDPSTNGFLIWTRVTDSTGLDVNLNWRVATDSLFVNVVQSGTATATAAHDFTVKVDVTGLKVNKWYYYQFATGNKYSLTGRSRTLPSGINVDSIRFAVVSCSNYEAGFYNVYQAIVNRNDVDVIVHLGDFIYEYGANGSAYNPAANRHFDPATECITKADYRRRYSQTMLDPMVIRARQQFPFICVWDDHEVANDSWMNGAENHTPATEGSWKVRKKGALETYLDWVPVRMPNANAATRIYRKIGFGKLIDLYMIDSRHQGRTIQMAASDPNFNDTSRTVLGVAQRNWLFSKFNTSTAKWQILGNQMMLAPLTVFGSPVNTDQWDGYPADRNRLYNAMTQNAAKNFVVITGDIHTAWGNDLPLAGYSSSNRNNSAGVEFVTTSITSPASGITVSSALIQAFNSHVRYCNVSESKGFICLDVNKTRVQGDYYFVSTIDNANFSTSWGTSWYVNDGSKSLSQASAPTVRGSNKIVPLAPANPMIFVPRMGDDQISPVLLSIYPDPVADELQFQFSNETLHTTVHIYAVDGKNMLTDEIESAYKGVHDASINVSLLKPGTYVLRLIAADGTTTSKPFIKQ